MKKRSEKEKDLAFLRGEFEAVNNIFLAGFAKMKVGQDYRLRKTDRKSVV